MKMSDPIVVDTVALVIFFVFVGMLVLATASVAIRVGRWHLRGLTPPALLYRDLMTIGGLSLTFLMITGSRAAAIPSEYTRTVPWIVLTSGPALTGMGVFLYFEFFVIGHDTPIRQQIAVWFRKRGSK
jgi:hypothetical protein